MLKKLFARFEALKSERGATMIEYTLLAALIAVVAIIAITATGTSVNSLFTYVSGQLAAAVP
jgi:pilus assembly protein Flp/PilA